MQLRTAEGEIIGRGTAATGEWQPVVIPWNSPAGKITLVLESWNSPGSGRFVISRLTWWPTAPIPADLLRRVPAVFSPMRRLSRPLRIAACLSAGAEAWREPIWTGVWTELLTEDLARSQVSDFAVWSRVWRPDGEKLSELSAGLDDRQRVIVARTLIHYGSLHDARLLLAPLLPRNTVGVEVYLLMSRIERESGQPQRAWGWLRKAVIEEGESRPLLAEIDALRNTIETPVERQRIRLQPVRPQQD